jgi:hypothetical protein
MASIIVENRAQRIPREKTSENRLELEWHGMKFRSSHFQHIRLVMDYHWQGCAPWFTTIGIMLGDVSSKIGIRLHDLKGLIMLTW